METQIDHAAGHITVSNNIYLEISRAFVLIERIGTEELLNAIEHFIEDIQNPPSCLANFNKQMKFEDIKVLLTEIDDIDIAVDLWDRILKLLSKELPSVQWIRRMDYSRALNEGLWGDFLEEGKTYLEFESDGLFEERLTDKGQDVERLFGKCQKAYLMSGSW